jgi:hypothetical protein
MDDRQLDPQHLARARQAIALVTTFCDVAEHGTTRAAALVAALLEEDPQPEFLLSAVCALAAVLVNDLARATGTTPAFHLQALGTAAAMLEAS